MYLISRASSCNELACTNFRIGGTQLHKTCILLLNNFSHVAYPFTRLTQTNKMFEWSEECQNAFNTLKHLLTTAPVLSHPSTTDTFIFDTVGAVLSQMQNGEEVVTVYGSKILSKSQMGYCTTYQKLLQL